MVKTKLEKAPLVGEWHNWEFHGGKVDDGNGFRGFFKSIIIRSSNDERKTTDVTCLAQKSVHHQLQNLQNE